MTNQLKQNSRREAAEFAPERLIDHEAERLIIAAILAFPGFFHRVGPQLSDDCFSTESFRRVFQFARKLHEEGRDPVMSECYRAVLDAGKTAQELGLPVLSDLCFSAIELPNPKPWVDSLRRKAAARRAWRVAQRLQNGMESGSGTAEELVSAREELRSIEGSFETEPTGAVTLGDAFCEIGMDTLLAAPQGTIASPWEQLNRPTNGGPRPGELWLLASRPSVGKSTAALQWALTAAANGHRTLLVSLEMPRQDLLKRALSMKGNIPHGILVSGDLDRSWRGRVQETLAEISEYPLEITDKLRTLSALIAKVAATEGLGLLVVDYLGLVDPGGRYENRNQEVSTISRRLKLAALDYGIPIIALHQLNRANENENRRPQLSDLRDSGSLEQDADTVLLLDTPGHRKQASEGDKDAVDILLAKQRNGPRGYVVPLRIDGRYCRLIELPGSEQRAA